MPNWKLIAKVMGFLLFIEAGLMMLCQVVCWVYNEGGKAFTLPIIIALLLGIVGVWTGKNAGKKMGRKDGYIVVSMVWILFTLIGMFPVRWTCTRCGKCLLRNHVGLHQYRCYHHR